jgi:hypothetical protein
MKPAYVFTAMGATLALGLALGVGGYYLGYDHATTEATNQTLELQAVTARQVAEREVELRKEREAVDRKNHEKLRQLQEDNERLTAAVSSGGIRMYVQARDCVSEAPNTTGLDAGAFRAELHPTIAGTLLDITQDADELAIRHNALIEWVSKEIDHEAP